MGYVFISLPLDLLCAITLQGLLNLGMTFKYHAQTKHPKKFPTSYCYSPSVNCLLPTTYPDLLLRLSKVSHSIALIEAKTYYHHYILANPRDIYAARIPTSPFRSHDEIFRM
jgi:hypothetical protein